MGVRRGVHNGGGKKRGAGGLGTGGWVGWGLESLAEASGVDECDRLGELPLVALFRWGR